MDKAELDAIRARCDAEIEYITSCPEPDIIDPRCKHWGFNEKKFEV